MIPIFSRDHGEDPANRCPISKAPWPGEEGEDRCGHFRLGWGPELKVELKSSQDGGEGGEEA